MTPAESDVRRFWEKVSLPDGGGCMLWTGSLSPSGYGQFWLGGRMPRAHRVSLFIAVGPPPSDQPHAAHSCRNRHCVAPDHLRWASRSENARDKVRDGTDHRGERGTAAKLTAVQIADIRSRYAAGGVSQRALASEFGVCQAQIYRIVHNKRWVHLAPVEGGNDEPLAG